MSIYMRFLTASLQQMLRSLKKALIIWLLTWESGSYIKVVLLLETFLEINWNLCFTACIFEKLVELHNVVWEKRKPVREHKSKLWIVRR